MKRHIEPPDNHYLEAARGWKEMGNITEALKELAKITPALQSHPEILLEHWEIHANAQMWNDCLDIATTLNQTHPNLVLGYLRLARSLRELNRPEDACKVLLPILEEYPLSKVILYDLACYCARSGKLAEARGRLKSAFEIDKLNELRPKAQSEPDLEPLWNEIKNL